MNQGLTAVCGTGSPMLFGLCSTLCLISSNSHLFWSVSPASPESPLPSPPPQGAFIATPLTAECLFLMKESRIWFLVSVIYSARVPEFHLLRFIKEEKSANAVAGVWRKITASDLNFSTILKLSICQGACCVGPVPAGSEICITQEELVKFWSILSCIWTNSFAFVFVFLFVC